VETLPKKHHCGKTAYENIRRGAGARDDFCSVAQCAEELFSLISNPHIAGKSALVQSVSKKEKGKPTRTRQGVTTFQWRG
jgi:hypothetical protein